MTIGCFVVKKKTHVGSSAMLRHLCIENIVSFIVCNLCASFLWHRSNTSVMSSWYLPHILIWKCKDCFGANSEVDFTLSCSWWCRGERVRSSLYSSSPPPGTSRPCPAASAPAHHNWRGVEGICSILKELDNWSIQSGRFCRTSNGAEVISQCRRPFSILPPVKELLCVQMSRWTITLLLCSCHIHDVSISLCIISISW